MCVEKLYYTHCHMDRFEARVTGCVPSGDGYAVTLDRTAFYPEGGGQPCDLGELNGIPVLQVWEKEEEVFHLCPQPIEPGCTVTGQIDYARRFDLMQQHSGEHIVSGVIHRRYGYHNVGFHMGSDRITIDFDGPIPQEDLAAIEDEVNAAIWQDIPLHIWYPEPEELPHVGYRSKRELPWPVRIVEVPGFDKCACCGTHVERTGEIGLVKIFSCIKFHQGVRMEMACGGRAFSLLRQVFEENRQVSQAFSAKILETGSAARRMNEALAAEKFRSTGLERRVFQSVAESLEGRGSVVWFEEGLDSTGVRELADRIAQVCGGTAAVFSGSDEGGYSFCLAAPGGDLRSLCKEMTAALNGRGGGKPGFVQGSLRTGRKDIEEFFAARKDF